MPGWGHKFQITFPKEWSQERWVQNGSEFFRGRKMSWTSNTGKRKVFQEDHCTGKGLRQNWVRHALTGQDRSPTHTGLNKIRTYWFILRIKYKSVWLQEQGSFSRFGKY